ncbi:MAG: carboxypeptidase-like regulatory domain-containing protein, partial [Planctomycetes bacterium]|nr:carboxypeptidase-like regulatory domain-containing protein [Planctomycetota bacterium]
EGNFEVMGLSEGDLQVSVTVGGFADYKQDIKIQSSGNRVDIKLSKGGTVVGLGKAVGELDPGTSVSLINHESQSYRWYKTQPNMDFFGGKNVVIDENGQFEFQNIKPGTYLIVASDSKDATAKLDNIKVEEDRETDVGTLTFEGPGKARITVLEDGKPLRDVKVSLALGQWGGMAAHSAVTDGSGVALIEKVPAGTYLISTDLERDTFDTDARVRRSITIVAGKTVEFTLELRPQDGVRLFGRVTMNGQNVFNEVILVGQGPLANTVKTFQISDGGMYEFHGLKHGTYQFHAQISDDRPTAIENVTVTKDGDFEFTRDFRGVIISGTVNTPNNTPEERASVTMMIQDKRLLKSSLSTWLRGIISVNNDGKFELANVPEGEYQITAELAGVGSVTQDVTIQGGDVSGLSLSVEANSGSLAVTVKELVGKAISGGSFAMAQLFDSNGDLVTFSEQMSGLFTMAKGAKVKFPMVKPGTYVIKISASGYLITEIAGVNIKLDEATKIEVTMQASSELHLTVANPEITQAMLDSAVVKVVDDQGAETAPVTNMLEMWGNQAPPAVPTLIVRYLPPTVREIRIKLEGYAEITVQVDASTGNKNEKQETLIAE